MLLLCLIGLSISSSFACTCDQLWQRKPNDGDLNIYINKTMPGQYEMLTWQWLTEIKDGIWTVTVKRWPKIEYATGTLKFKNLVTNSVSHMGWKIKKNTLTWSRNQGTIFQPAWNMSVCNFNIDWGFKPGKFGQWHFRMGNITMSGDVGSSNIEHISDKTCPKKRSKRAPEDDAEEIPLDEDSGDGSQKPSIIKWLLRKSGLEQGHENNPNWQKKVEDLLSSWVRFLASNMYLKHFSYNIIFTMIIANKYCDSSLKSFM